MNPKYCQVSLGYKIRLPRTERLRRGGLKAPINLEK